jgi:tetratricopeptide (TPR) repeat protein
MQQRPLLRRALAHADHLLHTLRPGASPPAPLPAPAPITPHCGAACPGPPAPTAMLPDAQAATDPAAPVTPMPPAAPAPSSSPLPEECREPHHQQGLVHARAHRWHWAQRELELAVRTRPASPAQADLESVRAVRRQLRRLQKWPRDAQAYLALGRAYFELELGAEAEHAWQQALALAPQEPAAYYLLAFEYLYRRATAEAERVYAQAQALAPELPSFAAFLADWHALEAEAGGAAETDPASAQDLITG